MALSWIDTTRDWVIIIWGLLSIASLLFFLLFLIALWRGISRFRQNLGTVVNEDIKPILATGNESLQNVTGTTRFVGDAVATPIIRLYQIIAGLRQALAVLAGLTRRGEGKQRESS